MAIKDHKLIDFSFKHKKQLDRPNMTVPQFKAALDSQGEELQEKLNGLVTELDDLLIKTAKDFGAKGDGVSNDASLIQLAINNVQGNRTIIFPRGKYKISSDITNLTGGDIVFRFESGASLEINTGVTVTLNGTVEAAQTQQIFYGEGNIIGLKNQHLYPEWWGASGSILTTSGSINSGTRVLLLTSAIDFKDGQGIVIEGAGAVTSLSTPSTPNASLYGATGTTSYSYQVLAISENGGCTAASPVKTIINAYGSFDSSHYIKLSWSSVAGASCYAIYGRTSGNMQLLTITSLTSWKDGGSAAITPPSFIPSTPPLSPTSENLSSIIISGGGTPQLTLRDSAVTTVTNKTIAHIDTSAFASALSYAMVNSEIGVTFKLRSKKYPARINIVASGTVMDGNATFSLPFGYMGMDYIFKIEGNKNKIKSVSIEDDSRRVLRGFWVTGDDNELEKCNAYNILKIGTIVDNDGLPNTDPNSTVMIFGYGLIWLAGNRNVAYKCNAYNSYTGIKIEGTGHKVLHSSPTDNVNGIHLLNTCRTVEIGHCSILNNNAAVGASGADGILAQRNVSGIWIHHNEIAYSGEHAMYFQGDTSIIESNLVHHNQRSGLKLAAHQDGLYSYDAVANGPYFGHDIILRNNVCYENVQTVNYWTGADIYLQSPLKDIMLSGNQCHRSKTGLKIVHTLSEPSNTWFLNNIKVSDNICNDHIIASGVEQLRDMYIAGDIGLEMTNNTAGDTLIVQTKSGSKLTDALIQGNTFYFLSLWRTQGAKLYGNRIYGLDLGDEAVTDNLGWTTENVDINFRGNYINIDRNIRYAHSQNKGDVQVVDIRYIRSMDNNEILLLNSARFRMKDSTNSGVASNIKSFSGNDVYYLGATTDYVFDTNTGFSNGCQFIGNKFRIGDRYGIRLYGNHHLLQGNVFYDDPSARSGTTPVSIISIEGTDCVSTGNIAAEYSRSQIKLNGTGNIATNNMAKVVEATASTNTLAYNKA